MFACIGFPLYSGGVGAEEPELITAAAIARLAGVGRAAVSNWRKRYPEFPKPAGGSPSSPTFDRAEVVAWLMETGKADQLATAGRTDGGTLRTAIPRLDGIAATELSFDAMFAEARQELPERSIGDLLPHDLLARTIVALLPRSIAPDRSPQDDGAQLDRPAYLDRWSADGEPYRDRVDDDAELPVVVDPACGAAGALMAVADRFGAQVGLAGQDIDERAARIAAFNLSGNSHGARYEVHAGDSFTDSQLDGYLGRAAAVVCEPPLDRPDWPATELTNDPRWKFGIPAPRDGELAWVQHCYAHLRPHGVAVVAVSRRTCVAPSGEQIRAALVRTGVLRTVIALPTGMSSVRGTDICLWVLQRPSFTPDRPPVRVVDLSRVADPADLPLDFAAWQQLLDSGDPAVVRTVERLELLDEAACLLPPRYLMRADASADDLHRVTSQLTAIYAEIGRGLPRFSSAKAPLAGRRSLVTLAELERVGALTIRARDDTPRAGDVLLRTQGRPPVVTTVIKGAADDEIGHLAEVTGIAQVIEIDDKRLDPHFVALFLREDIAALPVANTLGAINRDDLRRCRIPRIPLAEQRRYGHASRMLIELEQALAKLSDLSARVIEQTIYALTTGVVAPEYKRVTEQGKHDEKERRQ